MENDNSLCTASSYSSVHFEVPTPDSQWTNDASAPGAHASNDISTSINWQLEVSTAERVSNVNETANLLKLFAEGKTIEKVVGLAKRFEHNVFTASSSKVQYYDSITSRLSQLREKASEQGHSPRPSPSASPVASPNIPSRVIAPKSSQGINVFQPPHSQRTQDLFYDNSHISPNFPPLTSMIPNNLNPSRLAPVGPSNGSIPQTSFQNGPPRPNSNSFNIDHLTSLKKNLENSNKQVIELAKVNVQLNSDLAELQQKYELLLIENKALKSKYENS
eukprot:NODE_437_length_7444_cov_0.724711.p5 type:complete len:276 gc:universal NODE_437_length_7444_cov_0.724711:6037-5210(-)